MGDTLSRVAIEISRDNTSFKLWDEARVVVALSWIKFAMNLIFVGSRHCSSGSVKSKDSMWTEKPQQWSWIKFNRTFILAAICSDDIHLW
eukprot:5470184-Ditylum_brightwellii.AAC.1